ncbi:ribonuclease R [Flavobacteriaceae bacterium]|nr:ribonuclease R [Flavobacteriaceae bacterium]MDB4133645.1 ribonuclease R [Flavobacteriaceae bacterium]MDC0622352.1 ribonuclease R [Flavobacteriaceae bacterium]
MRRRKNKIERKEKNTNKFVGTLDVSVRGVAVVVCESLEEKIHLENIGQYLHNDLVEVYVFSRRKKNKYYGEITNLLKREKKEYVGKIEISDKFSFVIVDNKRIHVDIFVPISMINKAKDRDKVLVEITEWKKNSQSPNGIIKKVLGIEGEHNTEIHSILAEYGLPYDFEKEIKEYANNIDTSINNKEVFKRRDFRNELTFTIDPVDAKDFDDAISFKKLSNNSYEIGVHIADVSHYLKPNTILDKEAFNRATSVYLVDRVVPMLPEILSNKACSLRPNEEKYTFSAVFTIDNNKVINEWFGKTIINSNYRFSYEEAQEIIETKNIIIRKEVSLNGIEYSVSSKVKEAVLKLNDIAIFMRKERMKSGAISFDKKEVRFNINKQNEPIGVYVKESKESNKLVEEFMLLANRKVSEYVGKKIKKNLFIYRVHDLPDESKIKALKEVSKSLGYNLDISSRKKMSESLNKILKQVKGKKEQSLIESLAIRSMSKAEYTTKNIGHYGLSFEYYSHFTSPIRRYPDVIVHRLLEKYINKENPLGHEAYNSACDHCTQREILATKAERDSIKFMQIKFMQDKTNKKFNGIISGITDWGIFVEIVENKCEGMIPVRDLKGDYYIYNKDDHSLIGKKNKIKYQLGDAIQVQVKHADLIKKQLDFILAE